MLEAGTVGNRVTPAAIWIAAIGVTLIVAPAVAAEPKIGLALAAAIAFASLAFVGFAAMFAAWTVSFFIPFFAIGNVMLKAGLVLTAVSVLVTVTASWPAVRVRLRMVTPFLAVAVAFLAWLAASVLWAFDTQGAVSQLWKQVISVGIFAAVALLVDSKRHVRLIVAAFVLGAAITALCALLGFSGGPVNSLPGEGRLQGGTGDPNVLGAAVIAGLVLSAGLLKGARAPASRLLLLGAFVIFGLAAAGTGSRGGTVAVIAAFLLALLVMPRERKAVLGVAVAGLLAGAVWLASSPGSLHRLTNFGDRGDGRSDLWRIAWEMGVHHPVQGVGLENFIPLAPQYVLHPGALTFIHLITEKPVVVHNTYLQFFAETGIVGVLLFLILVTMSLGGALKAASVSEKAGDLDFAQLCRCIFVAAAALLVAGFFISAGVDYKLWAVLGLGPAVLAIARRREASEPVARFGDPASAAVGREPDPGRPRVAVIVPCFNDGKTLENTLSSLKGQEECEVVVVDDGSDDPLTLDVLDRLRAAGMKVVSQPNRGLAAARMTGLAETEAPYIHPLDADDELVPDAIRRLADVLDDDPGVAFAWGDQRTFGEVELTQRRGSTLDPWAITYVNQLTAGLIRRDAILEVGGWVLKVGYEDWDLWMGLAEHSWRGVRVDATTYRYRISSSRMLSGARSHHADLYGQMRHRHRRLFADRARNRRKSTAPLRMRLLLPLVDRLPASALARHRVSLFICEPGHALRVRLARRRGVGRVDHSSS